LELTRRRLLALVALICLGAAGAAWAFLPGATLRWGLVKVLRDIGMVEASISDADLSLFAGHVVVRRMVARPPSGQALGLKDLALRFRWQPLLHKRLTVERVALEGLEIGVERKGDGFIVNGLPLAVAAAGQVAAEPGTPWSFDVASFELTGSRLVLDDGKLHAEIVIDRLAVENLQSWDPQAVATYHLQGSLNGAAIDLRGSATPFAGQPTFDLRLVLQHLDLTTLAAIAAEAGLSHLSGHADCDLALRGGVTGNTVSLMADGSLSLTNPDLAASGTTVKAESLAWSGTVGLNSAVTAAGKLEAKSLSVTGPAEVSAQSLTLALPHATWDGGHHRLALAATLDLGETSVRADANRVTLAGLHGEATELGFDAGSPGLDWRGSISVAKAHVIAPGVDASPETLAWSGRLALDLAGAKPAGRAEGLLDVGPLQVAVDPYSVSQRKASAEGWVEFGRSAAPVTGRLKLVADGVAVREPGKAQDWLAAEHVEGADIALAADGAISAGRVAVDGLAALRRDRQSKTERGFPWRVEAKSLRLDRPSLSAAGAIATAEARVDGLTLRLIRTANGFVGLSPSSSPPSSSPPSSSPPNRTTQPAAPMQPVALGRLNVGGNSRVLFEDHTTGEPVRIEFEGIEVSASALDSTQPDRDSPFSLKTTVGEASIAANGSVRPFAADMTGQVKGVIRALELPPLSPYMADTMGVDLHTGHFDGDLQVQVKKGTLDGRMDLVLSNLFVAQPDPNAPIAKKVEMPIETVLDLLRDGEDRIRLTLPIGGDLANPDLDVSDAVSQAVAGALKSTMLTTLKVAFPVAALISLVVDADEKARLSLAPLTFTPGEAALADEHRSRLTPVGELMKSRPGLKLTLCGKADAVDWPVLAERKRQEENPLLFRLQRLVVGERKPSDAGPPDRDVLSDLADRRAAAAKEFLVDHAGIDPGRLYNCRPEVEEPAGKGPRVDLLL
jgi:uncharacterized protein involved in outer membrane biogenesis